MMMRMMVPLPLRATEAICPNNKNIDDGYEDNKMMMMMVRSIEYII